MEIKYAIVDGAIEEGLLAFLSEKQSPNCCLFPPPVQPDLVALAPYLLEVTPEVDAWLGVKDTPWGLYLFSDNKIHILVQHFRRYLWVNIPDQSKPVLFRFYDPRNIWVLTKVLTPADLCLLVEPVNKISTYYAGKEVEDNFPAFRQPDVRRLSGQNNTMLTLTRRQYDKLSRQAQHNYIEKLSLYIHDYYISVNYMSQTEDRYLSQLATDYFMFCQSLDIIDDRSIRGITLLLLKNDVHDSADIPQSWLDILNNQNTSAHNRVERLLLQELGFVPQ